MFAQQLAEMLTPTTFESFRVYSLDTIARLAEAIELAEDVRQQRVPKPVLAPICEELEWSFSKDSAVAKLAQAEIVSFLSTIKDRNNVSLDTFIAHLRLITKLARPRYKKQLEEIILRIFGDPQQKIELRKITGFWCSHVINLGYSRRHVLASVNAYFFTDDIQRIGAQTLSRFFGEFDGNRKRFVVHAAVSRDLGNYLKGLGYTVRDVATLTPDQIASLNTNPNIAGLTSALEIRAEEFDPFGAMNFCYQSLSAQRAIGYLDPYGMQAEWGDTMHVARLRANHGVAITKGDFLTNRPRRVTPRSGFRLRSISAYARSIITNFNPASTERLLSSIRTAALARTSLNPENQLISLWSAIEVLLSEPRDTPRIVHYASLIVPCVTLRHTRRQVIAIYDELLVTYRSRFNRLIEQIPGFPDLNGQRAFAEMMFLPEHAQMRTDLCSILSENPLALHRVWKLNHDYRDVKAVHRTLCDHFDRVRWQMHRVYRARNQLVHSGRMPTYLESVILNLAEYYRSSISTIVNRAKMERHQSDIDQTVAEIAIQSGILRGHFEKRANGPLTKEQVTLLMDFQS